MARKKLSEFRAKSILYGALGRPYEGVSVDMSSEDWSSALSRLPASQTYAVKVDQGVKGRFKKGLVRLGRSPTEAQSDIELIHQQGYRYFLVEPDLPHDQSDEYYFACARTGNGLELSYTTRGGVDVENDQASITRVIFDPGLALPEVNLDADALESLIKAFETNYFSFLEVNPLITKPQLQILDAAVEVDSEADFFVEGSWSEADLRDFAARQPTKEERVVRELADQSQASFSLEVLNPNGGIFVLLSGGGASVVLADEVKNLGLGSQLANYGEYSGNPTREETQHYTAQVISLLLASKAKRKILVIGGGVANFTDVRATFAGVIDALKTSAARLKSQKVRVYVRRGGPYEKEGLEQIMRYLEGAGLLGAVHGPELMLTEIVAQATAGLEVNR